MNTSYNKTVNIALNKRDITDLMQMVQEYEGTDNPLYHCLSKGFAKLDKPDYRLSAKQNAFVKKAKKAGYKIRWDYSGRGMFGAKCPAVVCPWGEFAFAGAYTDNMGRDMVIYVPY